MSMISTISWVRRGVAKEIPEKVELDEDDIAALIQERGEDVEDEEENNEDEEEWSDMDMDTDEPAAKGKKAKAKGKGKGKGKAKDAMHSDTDSDDDADNDLTGLGIDFGDTAGEDGDGVPMQLAGLGGLVYYTSNKNDPYITLKDAAEDDEIEDFRVRPTDNLILVGQTEEEHSRVEVYVYEEADDNAYVHHDILVGGMPLCLEWMDYDPAAPDTPGNLVAVGTMLPNIDIWDLDVVDGLEPVCSLGEVPEIDDPTPAKKTKGKKGKGKSKARAKAVDATKTHTDAVLGLSWNKPNRHLLASASADRTVKLWDLTQGVCAASFTHHTDKVQSVQWNPREPTVLCTGSYDRTAAVLDARAPAQVSRWHLGTDVEAMAWNPFRPEYFMVGLDNGMVVCCDARVPEKPAYTVHAHDKAACGLAFSAFIPDCMVTSGVDKVVKVWDVKDNAPACLHSEATKLGPVYSVGFSPDSPLVVAAGGGKGKLRVWNVGEYTAVQARFAERIKALQS